MLAGLHDEYRVADDLKLVHRDDNLPSARLGEPGRLGESGDLEQRRHSATLVVDASTVSVTMPGAARTRALPWGVAGAAGPAERRHYEANDRKPFSLYPCPSARINRVRATLTAILPAVCP
jgi:hypothetical protein